MTAVDARSWLPDLPADLPVSLVELDAARRFAAGELGPVEYRRVCGDDYRCLRVSEVWQELQAGVRALDEAHALDAIGGVA